MGQTTSTDSIIGPPGLDASAISPGRQGLKGQQGETSKQYMRDNSMWCDTGYCLFNNIKDSMTLFDGQYLQVSPDTRINLDNTTNAITLSGNVNINGKLYVTDTNILNELDALNTKAIVVINNKIPLNNNWQLSQDTSGFLFNKNSYRQILFCSLYLGEV